MTITISIPNIEIVINNNQNLNLETMATQLDQDLSDLLAEVTRLKSLPAGVSAVFAAMQKKIADTIAANVPSSVTAEELATIQEKVKGAIAEMKASDDAIAKAIVDNTDASTPAPTDGSTTPPVVPPVTTPPTGTGDGSTTTPTPDPTPAPVDTTPAPPVVDTPAPVDGTPAPVDSPETPVTPSTPTGPTAPTGPVTNPDGSTVI